jgi:hypothetical protein
MDRGALERARHVVPLRAPPLSISDPPPYISRNIYQFRA